jgi:hypothetical protein
MPISSFLAGSPPGKQVANPIFRRAEGSEKICSHAVPVPGCKLVCTRPLLPGGTHLGDAWQSGWHMAHDHAGLELVEWRDGDLYGGTDAIKKLFLGAPYNGPAPTKSSIGNDEITEWDLLPDAKRGDYENLKTREQLNGSVP